MARPDEKQDDPDVLPDHAKITEEVVSVVQSWMNYDIEATSALVELQDLLRQHGIEVHAFNRGGGGGS